MNDQVVTFRNVPVYNGYTNDKLEDGIFFTYNLHSRRLTVNGRFDVKNIIMHNMETGTVTHQFPKLQFFYHFLQERLENAHEQVVVRWLKATRERCAAFIIESTAPPFVVTLSYSMVPSFALQLARNRVQ